jgi:hemolysin activation/secretion protein
LLHQVEPERVLPERQAPDLLRQVEKKPAAHPAGPRFVLRGVRFSGVSALPEAELRAIVAKEIGRAIDYSDLDRLTGKISDHYRKKGYPVANAYLPAQRIADGVVEIGVLEGKFGKARIDENTSRLSDDRIKGVFADLPEGAPVTESAIERRLLLLGDHAGINQRANLVPGGLVGQTDVAMKVNPGTPYQGYAEVDNGGSLYTGRVRGGGNLLINNPGGFGDLINLYVRSAGPGLNFASAGYEVPVTGSGLRIGTSFAFLDYNLGQMFTPLMAHGDAYIGSAYASYPLIRSRALNLYAREDYVFRRVDDRQQAVGSVNLRYNHKGVMALQGDWQDGWLTGGIGTFRLAGTAGNIDMVDPTHLAIDGLTAHIDGDFHKVELSLMRLQQVAGPVSFYGNFNGQLAMNNLDSIEKFYLGGPQGVRAYPQGEAGGDDGYVLNLELRYSLASLIKTPGRMALTGFWDQGQSRINHNAWAPGVNNRNLQATGVAFNWYLEHGIQLSATVAVPVGPEHAVSETNKDQRYWLHFTKTF